MSLQWRHSEHDGLSNHQPYGCFLNHLFRRRSKKTSKLRVTGLCEGNSPVTGEFPSQRASIAKNVSIWWRHHVIFVSWMWYRHYILNLRTFYETTMDNTSTIHCKITLKFQRDVLKGTVSGNVSVARLCIARYCHECCWCIMHGIFGWIYIYIYIWRIIGKRSAHLDERSKGNNTCFSDIICLG